MKRIIVLGLVVLMMVATGCTTSTPIEAKPPLKIGWSLWPGFYPLILADKLGYFTERGLRVDARLYPNFTDVPSEFAAGRLDGALVTVFDALPANARPNADVSPIVMITDNTTTGDAIVATPEIKSLTDLKGKTIAVGFDSYAEVLIRAMLEQAGLSANDVHLVDVPAEEIPAQLGVSIDAGHTFDPFVAQAVAEGNHVIFTGEQTPGLLLDVLMAHQSVLTDRPDDMRAFVDAFFKAQDWWLQHRDEGNRIIAEATGQKPEDITTDGLKMYDRADNIAAFTNSQKPDSLYNGLDGNLQQLLSRGTLNHAPDLNKLIDPSFLQ